MATRRNGALPAAHSQRRRHLVPGYSEPNAGSDLASLRTEARLENGEWVINGQKTWTTMGSEANWIFLLVRTERSARGAARHQLPAGADGQPGIEVRPILNLSCTASSAKCFSTTCGCPTTAWSAESTRVGAWPRRCSVSSGSSSVRPSSPPSLSSAWSAWPGTWDCGTTLCSCAASPR
ncbi:acyl-CoA dehydrogenase family protein [Pseudomonas aeruginosa]|nr:acyl-CoA dehydrogenase family protein [Pseudomonas aeruginosa]